MSRGIQLSIPFFIYKIVLKNRINQGLYELDRLRFREVESGEQVFLRFRGS